MSDLISRQTALDAIQQRADKVDSVYSAFWEGLIIAQDIVKNVPSVEPERKWIPCSERLPDWDEHRDDMVLVCYGNGSVRFDACMNGEWVHGNPIAWMPLPEPYRGEE